MSTTGFEVVILIMAAALAFASSAWVQATSRLGTRRAKRLREENEARGRLLVRIAENPRPYLAAAILVMLLARSIATVVVALMLSRAGVALGGAIAVAAMTFVLFQVGEIAPRSWVLERPDQVMLLSARPVYFLGTALRPVIEVMVRMNRVFLLILPGSGLPKGPLTSEEEIMSMLEFAESEEVIQTQEREMIHSIFEFGDTVVREVMVPRPDMVCVDAASPLDAVIETALSKHVSRLPVIRGQIDDVVGVVHLRDVMKRIHNGDRASVSASDVMREAAFVPETKKVAELLREMQKEKTQMAIVVDEYGGTAGLATMEDLLEEIVGEISDEHETGEAAIQPAGPAGDNAYRLSARVGIDELNQLLDASLPSADWDSVGGLVSGLLGRVPVEGDKVRHEDVEFRVEAMKGRRIERVYVRRYRPGAKAG